MKKLFFEIVANHTQDKCMRKELKSLKNPHDLDIYFKYKFNVENLEDLVNKNYKVVIIVRDPYAKLFSGICNKFIKDRKTTHRENYEKISRSHSKNIKNVYDWFIENVDSDIETINFKNMIDFFCLNTNHNYKIDCHFMPISHQIPHYVKNHKNLFVFKLEDENLIQKICDCISISNEYKHLDLLNKTNYVSTNSFNEEKCLEKLKADQNIPYLCEYYRESVRKRYREDFEMFNYQI